MPHQNLPQQAATEQHLSRGRSTKTVLLTGASGVLGSAVLPRLSQHSVVALVRSRQPEGVRSVRGDIGQPQLGLNDGTFAELAESVDIVVHCAGQVDFAAGNDSLGNANVDGVRHIVDFAKAAEAPIVHVSTAFVARALLEEEGHNFQHLGNDKVRPQDYVKSKLAGEKVVQESGLPVAIVRPSVIIGDSDTGEMPEYQGMHTFIRMAMQGKIPLCPVDPGYFVDLVPRDHVAAAIAAIVDSTEPVTGVFPVVSGKNALTAEQQTELTEKVFREQGLEFAAPRLLPPDTIERLIKPVFFELFPDSAQKKLDTLVALSNSMFNESLFEDGTGRIPGGPTPLTTETIGQAWQTSMRWMIEQEKNGGVLAKKAAATAGV